MLLFNIMPSVTAPTGYKRRERVFKAVEKYMRHEGPEDNSSGLLRALDVQVENNVSAKDTAHFEILNVQAALANIIPVTFWNLYNIYSDPALFQTIRAEVQNNLTIVADVNGGRSYHLDVSKIRTSVLWCNLFFKKCFEFVHRMLPCAWH